MTPSFNQGSFIERTIRSVLGQVYPALEYIVCDAASNDETQAVLRAYADRVRIVVEPDAGQASAVNKGISRTQGEIIGWLNSDDIYTPEALWRVATYFAAHPSVDVVYGQAQLIDAQDRVLGHYYTEPWNADRLRCRCFLCQPAVFFRRRVTERWGLLDEALHFCMDYEYWLRLAAGGAHFAYLPEVLAGSRQHPATKTLSQRSALHTEINTMLRRRLGYVPTTWLLNHAHTLVELQGPRGPRRLHITARLVRLARQWNGSVSREVLACAGRTLVHPRRS